MILFHKISEKICDKKKVGDTHQQIAPFLMILNFLMHFTEVIRRKNHQKSPKIKIHKKITSNADQPTNMYHQYDS